MLSPGKCLRMRCDLWRWASFPLTNTKWMKEIALTIQVKAGRVVRYWNIKAIQQHTLAAVVYNKNLKQDQLRNLNKAKSILTLKAVLLPHWGKLQCGRRALFCLSVLEVWSTWYCRSLNLHWGWSGPSDTCVPPKSHSPIQRQTWSYHRELEPWSQQSQSH